MVWKGKRRWRRRIGSSSGDGRVPCWTLSGYLACRSEGGREGEDKRGGTQEEDRDGGRAGKTSSSFQYMRMIFGSHLTGA